MRQQALTAQVLHQRDSLQGERVRLMWQQIREGQIRRQDAGERTSVRPQVAELQNYLSSFQALDVGRRGGYGSRGGGTSRDILGKPVG